LRAQPANLFSFSIRPFIDKQTELTEEHFSNPNTLPMSVNLSPPARHVEPSKFSSIPMPDYGLLMKRKRWNGGEHGLSFLF
jgi:hypothetical protein